MDAKAQQDLYSIKKELKNIIDELRKISSGVRSDFSGIGNDKCADAITRVADRYDYVKKKLNNIDTSALSDEFVANHGSGGTSGGGGTGRKF